MSQKTLKSKVVEFKPSASELCDTVNKLSYNSENVFFGGHTEDRMSERGITALDTLRVLRIGTIEGEIEAGRSEGEWKCKMVARVKGSRDIGVVSVVIKRQRIFVKTVEWEDLR